MNVNLYSFSHTLLIHNHNTELLILLLMGPRLGIKTKGKGTNFNSRTSQRLTNSIVFENKQGGANTETL